MSSPAVSLTGGRGFQLFSFLGGIDYLGGGPGLFGSFDVVAPRQQLLGLLQKPLGEVELGAFRRPSAAFSNDDLVYGGVSPLGLLPEPSV